MQIPISKSFEKGKTKSTKSVQTKNFSPFCSKFNYLPSIVIKATLATLNDGAKITAWGIWREKTVGIPKDWFINRITVGVIEH